VWLGKHCANKMVKGVKHEKEPETVAAAVQRAADLVERLLRHPEVLLDPTAEEAKSVAEGARSCVKLFFDEAQARWCPKVVLAASDGLTSLVVDGFSRDQIWEELEVQNVPLRRNLRRRVKTLASAPKGAVSLRTSDPDPATSSRSHPPALGGAKRQRGAAASAPPSDEDVDEEESEEEEEGEEEAEDLEGAADRSEEEDEPLGNREVDGAHGPLEDDFFKLEDFEKFADMGDNGELPRLDEDAGDSDFDMLEGGGEGEDGVGASSNPIDDAKKLNYQDFFATNHKLNQDFVPGMKKGKKSEEEATGRKSKKKKGEIEDGPGEYIITSTSSVTVGEGRSSEGVVVLEPGARVTVLEIIHRKKEQRLRGRIKEPAGYISLKNTQQGTRWAKPVDEGPEIGNDEEDAEEESDEGMGDEASEWRRKAKAKDGEEEGDDAEALSGEEKDLEAQIEKLKNGPGEDSEGNEESESESSQHDDEVDAGDVTGEEEDEEQAEKKQKKTKELDIADADGSLYAMDKRLRQLEDEVSKMEESQMDEKHWSLRGEVNAKQRPLNSLLEMHLDQPMTNFAARRAEDAAGEAGLGDGGEDAEGLDDVAGAESLLKSKRFDIDSIIKSRIWDEAFDDVIRKTELPPSQRPQGADGGDAETLNFEKSRVGLGEVYQQQYEAELLGNKSEKEEKEDKDKSETKELFAKLMFKLDQLTNAHFTPRPVMAGLTGQQLSKVASLKMEETIPLVMSDAALKAPEELRAPRRHDKERGELTHEERTAARRAKKDVRRRKLDQKVESGEMTLAGRREREKKLMAANQRVKDEDSKKGTPVDLKKRLRSSELMAQAAENASADVRRKAENKGSRADARKEAQRATGASTLSSKKLKL